MERAANHGLLFVQGGGRSLDLQLYVSFRLVWGLCVFLPCVRLDRLL
jgi:hypothetical protein